ncbi:MAG: Holliday junction branch migration protein RuvA [Synergistaceae bacterium]|nr:Holliday junction branch migration protein RuvA [Synergistaceae bacterium]
MIRSLSGKVLDVQDSVVILEVNGIGFEVICSRGVLDECERGRDAKIITCLQFSEAGAVIYGFASENERSFFTRLTSVKGVGGRTAIAILSELSLDAVVEAVRSADVSAFARVPGIGKKTAERLCFELKNIDALRTSVQDEQHTSKTDNAGAVIDALLSLGFSRADAGGVINLLRAAHGEDFVNLSEEDMLRLALRELHK